MLGSEFNEIGDEGKGGGVKENAFSLINLKKNRIMYLSDDICKPFKLLLCPSHPEKVDLLAVKPAHGALRPEHNVLQDGSKRSDADTAAD